MARIVIVPASVIAAEPDMPFTASSYIQNTKAQNQRRAAALKKIKEGHAGIIAVAKERREVRERQRRLGITETKLP